MAKTLATVLGIVYVAMGVLGFIDTGIVGTAGFFAADALYSAVFVVIGAVLLVGAFLATNRTRGINVTVGALLALIALSGFLMVPDRGEMLGMLVNGADHWLNLLAGLVLLGSGLMERGRVGRLAHSM